MDSNESTFTKYQTWAYAIGATVTFLVSIRYGTGGWKWSDRFSFSVALLGLLCWWLLGSAWYAFAFAMLADGVGVLPVIRARGEGEDLLGWTLFLLGCLANVAGVLCLPGKVFVRTHPALPDLAYAFGMTAIILVPTLLVLHATLVKKSTPSPQEPVP